MNELRYSVLISVENEVEAKSAALCQRLTDEVYNTLSDSSIQGAVLSQTLTGTEDLEQLAQTYGISPGKAAIIQLLVEQDPTLTFEDMAKLSIIFKFEVCRIRFMVSSTRYVSAPLFCMISPASTAISVNLL